METDWTPTRRSCWRARQRGLLLLATGLRLVGGVYLGAPFCLFVGLAGFCGKPICDVLVGCLARS